MKIQTLCSQGMHDVTLRVDPAKPEDDWSVSVKVPSNGRQGRKHVPAHVLTASLWTESDGGLLVWECPACPDYVDSYDVYADDRLAKALA